MHEAVSPLPHMLSWYARGIFTFVLPTNKQKKCNRVRSDSAVGHEVAPSVWNCLLQNISLIN
jgi:hypothetical protein